MALLSDILANQGGPAVGTVHSYAGGPAPVGWLLCGPAAVSRATFARLFAAIGVAFGPGDGSTTFNVPNPAGIFVRSSGSQIVGGKTFDGGAIGSKLGHTTAINGLGATTSCTPTTTVNDTNLAHTHPLTDFFGMTFVGNFGTNMNNAVQATGATSNQVDTTGSALTTHNHVPTYNVTHVTTLTSTDTETAPAALSLNFIIKY